VYHCRAQFYIPSRKVCHRTALQPGGYHIQLIIETGSWHLLVSDLRKSKKQLWIIRLYSRPENLHWKRNPMRLFLHQFHQDRITIHWYNYFEVPQIRLVICFYYDGWIKYFLRSQRTKYMDMKKKIKLHSQANARGVTLKESQFYYTDGRIY
jgi:hypothetical protein